MKLMVMTGPTSCRQVFHIGGDETTVTSDCPLNETQSLEGSLLKMIENDWGKKGMGWEQLLFAGKGAPAALPEVPKRFIYSRLQLHNLPQNLLP